VSFPMGRNNNENVNAVIPSEARDLGSCPHQFAPPPEANTKIPRFARDDSWCACLNISSAAPSG